MVLLIFHFSQFRRSEKKIYIQKSRLTFHLKIINNSSLGSSFKFNYTPYDHALIIKPKKKYKSIQFNKPKMRKTFHAITNRSHSNQNVLEILYNFSIFFDQFNSFNFDSYFCLFSKTNVCFWLKTTKFVLRTLTKIYNY